MTECEECVCHDCAKRSEAIGGNCGACDLCERDGLRRSKDSFCAWKGEQQMSENDVKRILHCAFAAKCAVRSIEYKIKELETLREHITPAYSSVPGGGAGNKLEDLTAKIFEMQEKLQAKIKTYLKEVSKAEKLIEIAEKEDVMAAVILRQRYVIGYGWKKIGFLNHYSRMQLHRIHDKGIRSILKR